MFPTAGLGINVRGLYLAPSARGIGLGKALMLKSMTWSKDAGYEQVYLETMPELSNAVTMYAKLGYNSLHKALD